MQSFSHHRLKKTDDGVEVILYLNESIFEFANELGTAEKLNTNTIEEEARKYTNKFLPNLKVKAIKVMAGALLVTSFGFISLSPKAEAANNTQISDTTYQVVSGDSLSVLAARFGTTVDAIRQANGLSSDTIRIGQTLVIPANQQTQYVVVSGDSLFTIAHRFGTTVDAIKTSNQLTSDVLQVGQRLIIPTTNTSQSPIQTNTYRVVAGDSLFQIANRFGTSVTELKQTNNLTSDFLSVGQILTVPRAAPASSSSPSGPQTVTYRVVSGDTLSHIAVRYGTSVDVIRQANQLTTDFLRVGQVLTIPSSGEVRTAPPAPVTSTINQEDLELLAKLIFTEARGESLQGQIAVAAVIMNRVKSNQFPNNIRDVIFERSHGHFQFTPAGNGDIHRATPNATNLEAARRALNGEDPTNGSLFFYNPAKTNDQWVRSRTVSTIIGNHVFAL